MNHTPGPWKFDAGSGYVESREGGLVAIPRSGGDPVKDYETTQNANARLIAAAPEMLDALEAVQCECTILERISGHKTNCYMPQVQRALVKARGDL